MHMHTHTHTHTHLSFYLSISIYLGVNGTVGSVYISHGHDLVVLKMLNILFALNLDEACN